MSFFSRPAHPTNDAAHGCDTDADARQRRPLLTEVVQGGIWVRFEQRVHLCGEGRPFRRWATRPGFGPQLPSIASLLEIPFDRGERDLKGAYHVKARHPPLDRFHDTLAQIFGIGVHSKKYAGSSGFMQIAVGGQYNPMALLWRPPYKGRYGNVIESLFGNFSNQMKLFLPGAIRSSDPKAIRNAIQEACFLYRDVYLIIHQVILRYLHTPHSALHGMTPHEKWMAGMAAGYPLVPPLTPGVDRLFWRMYHDQRRVTEHGIGLFGLHYTTRGLHREVGKDGQPLRFDISYNVSDISRLAIFRGTTFIGDVYAKEVKLADKSHLQMSLAEHEISKKLARTDREARQELLNH